MTAQRDPDHLIRTYLDDGPTELPDRSYDAVRDHIDHTRQRVVLGPWRLPNMFNYARYGIVAAVIVVIAALGISVIPKLAGVGGPPSPAATKLPGTGPLAPGTYFIDDSRIIQAKRLSFTVPAGWTAVGPFYSGHNRSDGDGSIAKNGATSYVNMYAFIVEQVFGDVCQWRDTLVSAGTTVDDLMSALRAQTGLTASTPTNVTVGGFAGKRIELTTSSQEPALCQGGGFHIWPDQGPDQDITGLQTGDSNETFVVYAVDVAGKRQVIVTSSGGASAQDLAELNAVVNSIRIEP